MRSTLSMFMLASIGYVSAQTPNWLWARSGVGLEYDQASTVACDPYGFVVVAGYYSSDSISFGGITLHNNTPGFSDLFIVKYSGAGNVMWARSAGGDFDDRAYAVAIDDNADIYLTGSFNSSSIVFGSYTFTNAGSTGDMFLVKYDANGNVLWGTREGGPSLEIPYALAVDDDGNIVVAGRFSSNTITFGSTTLTQAGSMDVFVVKYDASGNVTWASGAGGGSNDEAYAVALRGDGDVIVSGYYTQDADFGPITLPNPGLANIFLAQCDGATGTFEWAKSVASDGDERPLSIALDASENIYAAGYFQGDSLPFGIATLYSTDFDNGWIARFDPDGDPVWAQGLDARSKVNDVIVANGGLYACGVFRNDSLHYGTQTLLIDGSTDLFLLKSDLAGTPQWLAKQTADGDSDEEAHAIAAHPTGQFAMAGMFDSDVTTFGPAQLINSNGYDAFVVLSGDADLGIGDAFAEDGIILSPNPGAGPFFINGARDVRRIEVYDAMGAMVHEMNVPMRQQRIELDPPALRPGLYHVRVSTVADRYVEKLVVSER